MKNTAIKSVKSLNNTWKLIIGLTLFFFIAKFLGNR